MGTVLAVALAVLAIAAIWEAHGNVRVIRPAPLRMRDLAGERILAVRHMLPSEQRRYGIDGAPPLLIETESGATFWPDHTSPGRWILIPFPIKDDQGQVRSQPPFI